MKYDYRNASSDSYFEKLLSTSDKIPFFFKYGGIEYRGIGGEKFKLISKSQSSREDRKTCSFRYSFADGIEIEVVLTHSYKFGETEWTVWFKNSGKQDSKILEDARTELYLKGENPALKGILGDHVNRYRPYNYDLSAKPVRFCNLTSRATHINFPYFNLEYGSGGSFLAIGWAGSWCADFEFDGSGTRCRLCSVPELKTYLKPGEKIRTALFVRLDYSKRCEDYATNLWRRWFIEENMPKADASGKDIEPFSTVILAGDTGSPNSDGSISENHITSARSLNALVSQGYKIDYRWLDAGWYQAPDGGSAIAFDSKRDWWATCGTWTPDPAKWPDKSMLLATDFARENGMKSLIWFEPERVNQHSHMAKSHGYNFEWAKTIVDEGTHSAIWKPDCYEYIFGKIKKVLTENRFELYREDNNYDVYKHWREMDSDEGEGREGINESKYVEAHYRLWDDIIKVTLSIGGCGFVDSCASGGGRNDIESMRRAVPILRSDADRTTTSMRLSMSASFNKWLPFSGAFASEKALDKDMLGATDVYVSRASYLPILNIAGKFYFAEQREIDEKLFAIREWNEIKRFLTCDFYVHTPWHLPTDTTGFSAFSYFDSSADEGIILAFRREDCRESKLRIKLPYAKEAESVLLCDADTGEQSRYSDLEAAEKGITLSFDKPRSARLIKVKVNSK